MIRVLHITVRSDPGGGPAVIETILDKIGSPVEHHVASPIEPPYCARFAALAGHSHTIQIPSRRFECSAWRRLAAYIRQHEIHVIHSHGFGAGLYGRSLAVLLQMPVVHGYHGFLIPEHGWAGMTARYFAEACLAPLTTVGVVCSGSELAKLCRLLPFAPQRLYVVHNAPGFTQEQMPMTPCRASAQFSVLAIGRLSRQKNPEALVRIAALLAQLEPDLDFRFHLVGDGPMRRAAEDQARNLGLEQRIEFHGAVRAADWLQRADVLLSASRGEGMPLALLEAMTAGLPVVASEVVGNVDVVWQDDTGYLFPPGDLPAAARRLAHLAKDPQLRSRLGARARLRVRSQFTVERFAASYTEIYRELASRRGGQLTEVPAP